MIETIVAFVNENYPRYKNLSKNEYFTKACLVYKFLLETYFKKTADINTIASILYNGLVDLDLKTNSNILENHLIFSFAFTEFYKRYQKGRGKHLHNRYRHAKFYNNGIFDRNCLLVLSQRSLLIPYNFFCIKTSIYIYPTSPRKFEVVS